MVIGLKKGPELLFGDYLLAHPPDVVEPCL
jgi:hypothetical protein